jgi:hypothetical protein
MHIKLAFGGAAAIALVLTFGVMRSTTEPVVASPAVVTYDGEPLPKSDNIRIIELQKKAGMEALQSALLARSEQFKSEPVQTETIVPPIIMPAKSISEPPEVKRKHKVRTVAYDICRGKGKRFTHGGRSWRCRR